MFGGMAAILCNFDIWQTQTALIFIQIWLKYLHDVALLIASVQSETAILFLNKTYKSET